jgi:hypothetical protein
LNHELSSSMISILLELMQCVLCLGEYTIWAWEECIFWCCWMKYCVNVNWIELINDTAQFKYIIIFLPAVPVNYW